MDRRAQQAREAHQQSGASTRQQRALRNQLVLELRAEDPQQWSYGALARAVGCSRELIAAIVKGRTGSGRKRS